MKVLFIALFSLVATAFMPAAHAETCVEEGPGVWKCKAGGPWYYKGKDGRCMPFGATVNDAKCASPLWQVSEAACMNPELGTACHWEPKAPAGNSKVDKDD